jgi:hypothetical protein
LLRRDEEFWRDLQAMTGLRIAIDHVAEQLYDGSTESTLEFNKAPFLTFMDWGVRLFGCDARCAIGFGSIYITTGTWLVSTLPWGAYDRYRAAYESGAAGGLAPPH